MTEENKHSAVNQNEYVIPRLILVRGANALEEANTLREQHNHYLAAVFGAKELIALDKSIEEYSYLRAQLLKWLNLLKYLLNTRIDRIKIQGSVLQTFAALGEFLATLEAQLGHLHDCITNDERFKDSLLERVWFFFRGAIYSKKARHTKNRMQVIVTNEMQFLGAEALKFLQLNADISLDAFYQLHRVLLKTKNNTWTQYLVIPYDFGAISSSDSIFLGKQIRRELFYRVVMRDKNITGSLARVSLIEGGSHQSGYKELKCIEDMLLAELSWNQVQISRLSNFWQRSTKQLVVQRHQANQEQFNDFCKKKVTWYFLFCSQCEVSSEQFDWIRVSLPANIDNNLKVIRTSLQSKTYYSRQKEAELREAVSAVAAYLQLPNPIATIHAIVQKYRAEAQYYTREDIIRFLRQDGYWQLDNFAKSAAILSDMLNVSEKESRNWVDSYLHLAQTLTQEMIHSGKDYTVAIQRLCKIVSVKSPALLRIDEDKLNNISKCANILEKLPKSEEPLFTHLARLLGANRDIIKTMAVINRYYISAIKILPKATTQADPQKATFVGVLYRHLVLLRPESQAKLASLPMLKHLAKDHSPLRQLLYPKPKQHSGHVHEWFKPPYKTTASIARNSAGIAMSSFTL